MASRPSTPVAATHVGERPVVRDPGHAGAAARPVRRDHVAVQHPWRAPDRSASRWPPSGRRSPWRRRSWDIPWSLRSRVTPPPGLRSREAPIGERTGRTGSSAAGPGVLRHVERHVHVVVGRLAAAGEVGAGPHDGGQLRPSRSLSFGRTNVACTRSRRTVAVGVDSGGDPQVPAVPVSGLGGHLRWPGVDGAATSMGTGQARPEFRPPRRSRPAGLPEVRTAMAPWRRPESCARAPNYATPSVVGTGMISAIGRERIVGDVREDVQVTPLDALTAFSEPTRAWFQAAFAEPTAGPGRRVGRDRRRAARARGRADRVRARPCRRSCGRSTGW